MGVNRVQDKAGRTRIEVRRRFRAALRTRYNRVDVNSLVGSVVPRHLAVEFKNDFEARESDAGSDCSGSWDRMFWNLLWCQGIGRG